MLITGSFSNGGVNLMSNTETLSVEGNYDVNYTELYNNDKDDNDHIHVDSSLDILLLLMDRSQLVMTIFGLIANMATALTLIKNGQVGGASTIN